MGCKYSARRKAAFRFLIGSAILSAPAYLVGATLVGSIFELIEMLSEAQPEAENPLRTWAVVGAGYAALCFSNYLLFLRGSRKVIEAIED